VDTAVRPLPSRRHFLALLAAPLLAQKLPKLGKPLKHPFGIVYALPKNWTAESGATSVLLLPPGVKVDAEREDNPEVYSLSLIEDFTSPEDPLLVDTLRRGISDPKIRFTRDGEREVLSLPGKPGVAYVWEFEHPKLKTPYRVKFFVLSRKEKLLALTCTGRIDRLAPRDAELRAIAYSLDYEAQ
jgi:hypothetical protein